MGVGSESCPVVTIARHPSTLAAGRQYEAGRRLQPAPYFLMRPNAGGGPSRSLRHSVLPGRPWTGRARCAPDCLLYALILENMRDHYAVGLLFGQLVAEGPIRLGLRQRAEAVQGGADRARTPHGAPTHPLPPALSRAKAAFIERQSPGCTVGTSAGEASTVFPQPGAAGTPRTRPGEGPPVGGRGWRVTAPGERKARCAAAVGRRGPARGRPQAHRAG